MSYETDDKMVSHPDHYKSGKYEVIDIIDEFTKGLEGTEAVCTANAIKYILRWKKKNGIQDVKKAIWYLTHLVEHLESCEESIDKEESDLSVKTHTNVAGVTVPDSEPWSSSEEHTCSSCKFELRKGYRLPCQICEQHDHWKSKEEADEPCSET